MQSLRRAVSIDSTTVRHRNPTNKTRSRPHRSYAVLYHYILRSTPAILLHISVRATLRMPTPYIVFA
ncbi:hypothetical protein BDV39DRAFT_181698 [Aspergillus sergii]|uniref:Uncharacterized protein n=1 Tax=Aspergillus sergii TaxID=1034303 RepID=A0A5N6WV49_9EURO|nr:hypothetical protein BDV39DRAFT_181698 [Aspergillus sergii]